MDVNNQRKPLLYYWLIALLIMGVINMFFLPFMTKNTIEQVNYDVFLTQMQNKNISQAEVNEDVIYFYLKDEDKSDKAGTTIFSENTQKVYSTVRMDDPQLVERLYNAGASFGEVKPREVSPWFSTLVMFVVFFLLWQFVMKKAMSKMGGIGNAMSFGKSNAKVYVKVTNSWYDPEGEKAAAQTLLDMDCDVIAQHCDTVYPQSLAQERGVYSIGYNSDMSKDAPEACLCSVIWNWSAYYTAAVQSVIEGTWDGSNYYGGMSENLVNITSLADFCAEGTAEKVEEARAAILSGANGVFDGVIETNTGDTVGEEGKTLDDATITGGINWYFKTVSVDD